MIVAIDGPAGVGKSTVARRCAEHAGFLYINSGSFYRAVTLAVLERNVALDDAVAVLAVARACRLELRDGEVWPRRTQRGRASSTATTWTAWVAAHSAIPEVRDIVNARLREIAGSRDAVVEGRDIGTVVFPERRREDLPGRGYRHPRRRAGTSRA